MKLKPYQSKIIEKLDYFCTEIQNEISESEILDEEYLPLKEKLPYLCVKVPTGGGKTIIGSSSLKPIVKNYLHSDYYTVLWLAPSETIVSQTLKALKDRYHPYREVIESDFRVDINPISIRDALRNRFQKEALNIVVATVQSYRTNSKEGRKFYDKDNGFLNGSLYNYLQKEKPVIIVDEAHKNSTDLSFKTLLNLNPSFILELTATPNMVHQPKVGKYASNILYKVSAEELKSEKMINLPIHLRTVSDYMQTLKDTIEKQKHLENLAKLESEYIRPIALIRAEENRGENSINFEKVEKHLIEDFKIPKEQIAVHTGNRTELDGKNLKSENCQIRFIITVDKLKEGWDCPFAYILSTVSNMNSNVSMEQLLGRVLRNPYVSNKKSRELNSSYVFAYSDSFEPVINSLTTSLQNYGFNREEANRVVSSSPETNREVDENLFSEEFLPKAEKTENFSLEQFQSSKVAEKYLSYNVETEEVKVVKDIPSIHYHQVKKLGLRLIEPFKNSRHSFHIPKALFKDENQNEFDFEESVLFENFEIDRSELLRVDNFIRIEDIFSTETILDIKNGKIDEVGKREYKTLFSDSENSSDSEILKELTFRVSRNIDIPQLHRELIREFVSFTLTNIEVAPHRLISQEYKLSTEIKRKLIEIINRSKQTLFQTQINSLYTDGDTVFNINCRKYKGFNSHNYQKHLCPKIEKMNSEEIKVAEKLDRNKEVEVWVKNGVEYSNSFWLQMANGKFYPDFLVRYLDGKIAVYEYKGGDRISNDDTKEKDRIGRAWANSADNLEFKIIGKDDLWQI